MGFSRGLRGVAAGALTALLMAGAAMADEEEAAAALNRALESGQAMLALVETVDGPDTLARESGAIAAAAQQARQDSEAVAPHAEALDGSETLRAEFQPKFEAYYARRNAVGARLQAELDPATFEELTVLMEGRR